MQTQELIQSDLEMLIEVLPPHIISALEHREELGGLLEVVMDLGRQPEARFPGDTVVLGIREVTQEDINYVITRIGSFGEDNRSGIERTLHRISAVRNRSGKIVGLTLRVGRAVYGTIRIIEDLVFSGKSILLLGKPGVGKTTMLREVARVLADDAKKRVMVVDTSNEIAGDGDIPHPGIGHARRMQVPSPSRQHAVMIEAVENHMPEVIVIDEIGTELEANAARTIAERGVQLVATAHGNTLDNLVMNPTLSDLVGGVHTVTLGDEEARRRRTQKTVLERRAPPTFDILIEIMSWSQVVVHPDVAEVVDRLLRGFPIYPETRMLQADGSLQKSRTERTEHPHIHVDNGFQRHVHVHPHEPEKLLVEEEKEVEPQATTYILPYGVNKGKLQQAMRDSRTPVELVNDLSKADLLLTTKNYFRRKTQALQQAEETGKPVYVLRKNTAVQIEQFFKGLSRSHSGPQGKGELESAIKEAEEAADQVEQTSRQVDLSPQSAYIRRLQHKVAESRGLASSSVGREPHRRVAMFRR